MKCIFVAILLIGQMAASCALWAQPSEATLTMAVQHLEKKQPEKARALLLAFLQRDPKNALAWFNLGNSEFMLKRYEKALVAYRKVIRLHSSLSPAAALYMVKCYRKSLKREKASRLAQKVKLWKLLPGLKTALVEEIRRIQEAFIEAGLRSYESKNYLDALKQADGALLLGPSSDASTLRALSLLKQGETEKARMALTRASRNSNGTSQAEARELISQIDQGKWALGQRPYWLFLDLGGSYNTNLFGDGVNESTIGKGSFSAILGGAYRWKLGKGFSFQISDLISWDEVLDLTSLRWIRNSLFTGLEWKDALWEVLIRPGLQYEILGADSFLVKPQVGFDVKRVYPDFEGKLQYLYRRNISASDVYRYLDGNVHEVIASWVICPFRWRLTFLGKWVYEGIDDLALTTGTLPLKNQAYGPGIRFFSPIFTSWTFSAQLLYLRKNYSNVEQPNSVSRDDHVFYLFGKLSKKISSHLGLFGSIEFTKNQSTLDARYLDDKNFQQWVFMGGLSWDLLP